MAPYDRIGQASLADKGIKPLGLPNFRSFRMPLQVTLAFVKGFLRFSRMPEVRVTHLIGVGTILVFGPWFWFSKRPFVCAIAGLGSIFSSAAKPSKLRSLVTNLFCRTLSRPGCHIIIQNEKDRDVLLNLQIPSAKITKIRGSGVPESRFKNQRVRNQNETKIILMPARLIREKGIYDAFDIAEALGKIVSFPFELLIAGPLDTGNPKAISASEYEGLKQRDHRVRFLGEIDDLDPFYMSADVVIQPSCYNEGLPKVIIEAFASQTPVVSYPNPGSEEIVEDGKTGFLVKKGEFDVFAQKIADLLTQPDLHEAISDNAYQSFLKNFTTEAVVEAHRKIYEKLVKVYNA